MFIVLGGSLWLQQGMLAVGSAGCVFGCWIGGYYYCTNGALSCIIVSIYCVGGAVGFLACSGR